eukprot:5352170-Ditylum_brightwellii.AAC.1
MADQAEMRQMLAVCGFRNNAAPNQVTQLFMDFQTITNVNDLVSLCPEDTCVMIKKYNDGLGTGGHRINIAHKRQLEEGKETDTSKDINPGKIETGLGYYD